MSNIPFHESEALQSGAHVNRNYKAGVFTHLFGEPKNELELYNAFSPVPYNVNKGFNDDIIKRSDNLHGYVTLVSEARRYEQSGVARAAAVKRAVRDCIAKGVLAEYLKNNASEVSNMLTQEWDWDVARAVWREEDKAEATSIEKINTARRMLNLGMSVEIIATATELTADEVSRLQVGSSVVSEEAKPYGQA